MPKKRVKDGFLHLQSATTYDAPQPCAAAELLDAVVGPLVAVAVAELPVAVAVPPDAVVVAEQPDAAATAE